MPQNEFNDFEEEVMASIDAAEEGMAETALEDDSMEYDFVQEDSAGNVPEKEEEEKKQEEVPQVDQKDRAREEYQKREENRRELRAQLEQKDQEIAQIKLQAEAQAEQYRRYAQDVQKELQTARVLDGLPKQLGIDAEETREALALMSSFKKDPVATAKEIVARTLEMGHNVQDILGSDFSTSVEMRAINHAIDNRLGPLLQDRQQQEARQQQIVQAQQAANAFHAKFPNARHHSDAIRHMMKSSVDDDGQPFTPETAYAALKRFAYENGLDIKQPLGPQLAAQQSQESLQEPQFQPAPAEPKPLPNGRSGHSVERIDDRNVPAGSEVDWEDIIDNVMRKTG